MKEGAGEEDDKCCPLNLYPHTLGLRLVSFRDQFVHPPNREIKEDPRDRPEEVATRPEILFAVVVLALLGLDVVVAVAPVWKSSHGKYQLCGQDTRGARLARLAELAFVAERLTFDLFVAHCTLHVAIAGRARGLFNARAAILVFLPLAFLWMAPFAARLCLVGGDAAQQHRHQSVPQSMREGHRSGSVVCCPAGWCCLRAAPAYVSGCSMPGVATDSLLVSQKIAQPKPSVPILLRRRRLIGWLHEILIEGRRQNSDKTEVGGVGVKRAGESR